MTTNERILNFIKNQIGDKKIDDRFRFANGKKVYLDHFVVLINYKNNNNEEDKYNDTLYVGVEQAPIKVTYSTKAIERVYSQFMLFPTVEKFFFDFDEKELKNLYIYDIWEDAADNFFRDEEDSPMSARDFHFFMQNHYDGFGNVSVLPDGSRKKLSYYVLILPNYNGEEYIEISKGLNGEKVDYNCDAYYIVYNEKEYIDALRKLYRKYSHEYLRNLKVYDIWETIEDDNKEDSNE